MSCRSWFLVFRLSFSLLVQVQLLTMEKFLLFLILVLQTGIAIFLETFRAAFTNHFLAVSGEHLEVFFFNEQADAIRNSTGKFIPFQI